MTKASEIATPEVNVRLVFTGDVKSRLVRLSKGIATVVETRAVLGTHWWPHVTLFSFAPKGPVPQVEPRLFTVSFTGLGSLGSGRSRLWVTADIRLTPGLAALREQLIADCGSPRLKRKEFRPHVTLANIKKADFEKVVATVRGAFILKATHVPCRLERIVLPFAAR